MAPVLVVEDDASTRELIARFLQLDGVPVVTASDGREGLERLRRERPAVVLLDLMMPIMDGAAFRQAQLEDPELSGIPTVLMTAAPGGNEHVAALGVDGLIRKPFVLEGLEQVVKIYLRRAT